MSQPRWRMIANLGDADPVTYGGFFVYVDRNGVYPPEVEVLEERDPDNGIPHWTMYRAIVERDPAGEWWYLDLDKVAASCGRTGDVLRADLESTDPIAQALVYRDLIGYFGSQEFDSYPRTYARRSDLPRRVRRIREGI